MRHISLYIFDPNFSCGRTNGLTKVFHEALADLKNSEVLCGAALILHQFGVAVLGLIWEHTVNKSHTNVTNVTIHPVSQVIWRNMSKFTLEKSPVIANAVTLQLFRQAIWGDIWWLTLEKNHTNATNVTLHLAGETIWRHIGKLTIPKKLNIFICIWVSFCRTGKMIKLCLKNIFFATSLWPNGSTFSTFLNCSEDILSCRS